QEVLSMRERQPQDLEALVDISITIDNIRRENEATRSPKTAQKNTSAPRPSTSTASHRRTTLLSESPNFVNQEERDRRRNAGTCIKCGTAGHGFKECKKGWTLIGKGWTASEKDEPKPKEKEKKKERETAKVAEVFREDDSSDSGKD